MRIIVRSRLWRAFPELDRYTDEQCERFVRAARRRGLWRTLGILTLLGGLSLLTAGLALSAAAFTIGTLAQSRSGNAAFTLAEAISALAFVFVAFLGFCAVYLVRDWLLRRRIAYVLRARGVCANCRYSLIGLPVSPAFKVHCPECAMESEVDPSLGELATDDAGQARFQPKPLPARVPRWFTPARVRWAKRIALWTAIALPVLAAAGYGLYEWSLARQAARAQTLRKSVADLAAARAKWFPSDSSTPQPGSADPSTAPGGHNNAWTSLTDAAVLLEQNWANAAAEEPPVEFNSQPVLSDVAYAFLPLPAAPEEDNEALQARREEETLQITLSTRVMQRLPRAEIDALLRKAPLAPSFAWDPTLTPGQPMFQMQLMQLGQPRRLARYNAARVREALAAGKPADAVEPIEINLALARAVAQQPMVISALVAIAVESLTYTTIRQVLAAHPPANVVQAIEAALQRQRFPAGPAYALESESIAIQDTIAWLFADPDRVRRGTASTTVQQFTGGGVFNFGDEPSGRLGSLDDNLTTIRDYFASIQREAAKDFVDRDQAILADDVGERSGLILVRTLAPALGRFLQSCDQVEVSRRGIRTLLALERFRLAHNDYPDHLSQLVPDFLPAIPLDPFSGLPLGYRRLSTDPAGRAFLLYAPGADKQDNQGKDSPDPFSPLRASAAPGFDYILNPPEN